MADQFDQWARQTETEVSLDEATAKSLTEVKIMSERFRCVKAILDWADDIQELPVYTALLAAALRLQDNNLDGPLNLKRPSGKDIFKWRG